MAESVYALCALTSLACAVMLLRGYFRGRARFLPYTTKSRFPQHPLLVRAYLAFPPAWLVLGRQTLYVGRRPMSSKPRSVKRT